MKHIQKMTSTIKELKDLTENVVDVKDLSDTFMNRIRVTFKNGLSLSIIRGEYSYGGPQGLFEIAPRNVKEELDGSLFDEEDQGEDVLGHCDIEKIKHYITKLGSIKL